MHIKLSTNHGGFRSQYGVANVSPAISSEVVRIQTYKKKIKVGLFLHMKVVGKRCHF